MDRPIAWTKAMKSNVKVSLSLISFLKILPKEKINLQVIEVVLLHCFYTPRLVFLIISNSIGVFCGLHLN